MVDVAKVRMFGTDVGTFRWDSHMKWHALNMQRTSLVGIWNHHHS